MRKKNKFFSWKLKYVFSKREKPETDDFEIKTKSGCKEILIFQEILVLEQTLTENCLCILYTSIIYVLCTPPKINY